MLILPIKRNYIYRKNKLNFNKNKTFCLLTIDSTWNDNVINPINKLKKSDSDVEAGENEGTIIVFNRYDDFDMQLPAIISVQWYKEASLNRNLEILIATHFKNELIRENSCLPEDFIYVIDEAHQLTGSIRDQLSCEFSLNSLDDIFQYFKMDKKNY